jgi:hypothetical protein
VRAVAVGACGGRELLGEALHARESHANAPTAAEVARHEVLLADSLRELLLEATGRPQMRVVRTPRVTWDRFWPAVRT